MSEDRSRTSPGAATGRDAPESSALEWVREPQATLRAFFGDDDSVEYALVREKDLDASIGENSRLSRLEFEVRSTSKETTAKSSKPRVVTLVAKRRPAAEPVRRVAALQAWFRREVLWYAELADAASRRGVLCPRCALARYDAWTGGFAVLLEDMAGLEFRDQHEAAVRAVARLHALNAPPAEDDDDKVVVESEDTATDLSERQGRRPPPSTKSEPPPSSQQSLARTIERGFPRTPVHVEAARFVEAYFRDAWTLAVRSTYELDDDVATLIDALAAEGAYATLLNRLARPASGLRPVLVHGDYRPDNLFVDSEGRVRIVDWQFASVASAAYDLAYFATLALATPDRRRLEPGLFEAYCDERRQAGDPDFADDADWPRRRAAFFGDDLRVAVLLALASFVIGAATARHHDLHRRSIDRLARAALDWGCDPTRLLDQQSQKEDGRKES